MSREDEEYFIKVSIIMGIIAIFVLVISFLMSESKKNNKSPFIPNYNFL